MLPPSHRTWCPPVHLLPAEILSIIFLLVADNEYAGSQMPLMLVCRHWYAIVRSTPGITSILWIRKSTTMEMVRAAIQGTRWLLNVLIEMDGESIGQGFSVDTFDACFMYATEVTSRCKFLSIDSFPPPGECKALQILPPLKNLESSYLSQRCDIGSIFEVLITTIATTATPRLTRVTLRDLHAVLYLVQPDCLHIFCSLTELTIWLSKRMESPANILPHLQRLEIFHAKRLYLPIYPPDAPLPLIQTLRSLSLRSVSVQWMAGKVFPVLRQCSITFPPKVDTIYFQPITMSACISLTCRSNDFDHLQYFRVLPLAELNATSEQWNVTRGNFQLMAICHMIVHHEQSLTRLELQVRCSGRLLIHGLSLLPNLEVLQLGLASPCALNETFFQAFIATCSIADSPCGVSGVPNLPLCLNLAKLNVKYKRWLRGPERTALLQVFGDIESSRRSEKPFKLYMLFDDIKETWRVSGNIESIHEIAYSGVVVGISSLHGIIPLTLTTWGGGNPFMKFPFKEAEYLLKKDVIPVGPLLALLRLVELRVRVKEDMLLSEPPPNLPLFHTLRVLEAGKIHPSFLAGQTFHKLERCRMSLYGEGPELSQDHVTQMPVCTRLDVDDLTLLATLALPQICELGASFDHPEFNMIWETHISVNANLSGLELLHVYGWYQQADLIQALRCLPVLKGLILTFGLGLDAAFFGEFVPIHPNEAATLMRSQNEGQVSPILCPLLRSFLIEGCGPIERVELIPVLEQVVTLRAGCGSPLERFTLSSIEFGRKLELIGSQGGFVVEMDCMDKNAKPFRLDI